MSAGMNVIRPGSDEPARPGYDHSLFDWSPMPARPPLDESVPRRLHLSVIIDLAAVEWEDSPETTRRPRPGGGRGLFPAPDFPRLSQREFGHRVGIFQVLDMTEQVGIATAVAMDALTVHAYPALADTVRRRAGEVIAHGLSASRPVTSELDRDAERHYISTTLELLGDVAPEGWLGPQNSATLHTLELLAAAGMRYTCDWANDDEPYATSVPGADGQALWIHPTHLELSDVSAIYDRKVLPWDYADRLYEAAATLARESARRPRVLTLQLHPWLTGQAHVIGPVWEALGRTVSDFAPRCLTPGQAVAAWRQAATHAPQSVRQP